MRISTMNMFYKNTDDGKGYLNSVIRTHKAGFEVMDFCMCPMQRNETELNGDDWKAKVYSIANEAAKLGVVFSQSHLPYPKSITRRKNSIDLICEENELFIETTKRCIEISGILGVKWAVVHPVMKEANGCSFPEDDIAYNHYIYDKYVEQAAKLGVGLAFENMTDLDGKRRFGTLPGELVELVKSYNSPENVGICWDFGHANRAFTTDQSRQLSLVLPYLRATHVDDNIGTDDLHTLPFLGNVNWEQLLPILSEGYTGDFNYEIKFTDKFPEHLRDEAAAFSYKIAKHLLTLADKG